MAAGELFPCRHCETLIRLYGIYCKEGDGTMHTDLRCIEIVKAQRDALRPKPPEFCANCPFAKHVHWEEGGKLIAPGCSGFTPAAIRGKETKR